MDRFGGYTFRASNFGASAPSSSERAGVRGSKNRNLNCGDYKLSISRIVAKTSFLLIMLWAVFLRVFFYSTVLTAYGGKGKWSYSQKLWISLWIGCR